MSAQPSLVDLAYAAEQAIVRYAHAAGLAASLTRRVDDLDLSNLSYFASVAIRVVRVRVTDDGDGFALQRMGDAIARGIVRPEWGLCVVAIAAAEQARREAVSDG